VKKVILWELRQVGNQTPALANRADALTQMLDTEP
jgi:hypothetical protein